MKLKTLYKIAALPIILFTAQIVKTNELNEDIEINNIYCQMNEFFRLRIQNGQNPLPCTQ